MTTKIPDSELALVETVLDRGHAVGADVVRLMLAEIRESRRALSLQRSAEEAAKAFAGMLAPAVEAASLRDVVEDRARHQRAVDSIRSEAARVVAERDEMENRLLVVERERDEAKELARDRWALEWSRELSDKLTDAERERDELRAAVFELCGMQLRITEQREAVAAYRKVANDASRPFSIRRVEALLGTELCDCGEPITHAGACSYGGR